MGYFENPFVKSVGVFNRPYGFFYNVRIWLSNPRGFFRSVQGFIKDKKGLGVGFAYWAALERVFALRLPERKLNALTKLSKNHRTPWRAHAEIGALYFELGDLKAALASYLEALRLGGAGQLGENTWGVTDKIVRTYVAMGQHKAAEDILLSSMKMNKDQNRFREFFDIALSLGLVNRPEFVRKMFEFFSNLEGHGPRFRTLAIREVWESGIENSIRVFDGRIDRFKFPIVFEQAQFEQVVELQIPPLFIHEFSNALVIGALNVIVDGQLIIFEKGNNPQQGFVSGSWKFIFGSPQMGKRAVADLMSNKQKPLEKAILISSRCTFNYYHWLIEYLPRLILCDRFPDLKTLPILVHADMPKQHFEALKLVAPDARLETFVENETLAVKRLVVPTIPTTHIDDVRLPLWQSAGFCRELILEMREKILKNLNLSLTKTDGVRRVYLSRRHQRGHKLVNESQLERIFKRRGFEIVYPEKLNFSEQVKIFNDAAVIAGPSGGTFANVIFCRPGAKVVVLIVESNKEYCTHQNLTHLVGADFYYVTGEQDKPREHYKSQLEWMVSSFFIDPMKIERALKAWL